MYGPKNQCAQLVFMIFLFLCNIWLLLLNNKNQIPAKKSWFQRFSVFVLVLFKLWKNNVHHFFLISVFRKRAQKRAFFKTPIPAEKSWFEANKNTICFKKCIFGDSLICNLCTSFLFFKQNRPPQKKTIFVVLFETHFLHFFTNMAVLKRGVLGS